MFWTTMSGRWTASITAACTALTGAWVLWTSQMECDHMVAARQDQLRAVAATLAAQVNGQALTEAAVALPDPDALSSWHEAPEELRHLRAALESARRANLLETDIYTLHLKDALARRVAAEPNRVHPQAMEFWVASGPRPYWRHSYEYRPEMAAALFGGRAAHTDLYQDQHGHWLSAYAPIKVPGSEEVVGLVEVDLKFDEVMAPLARRRAQYLGFAVVVLLLGIIATAVVTARSREDLERLAESAAGVGDERELEVHSYRTTELQTVADSLNRGRERVDELLASAELKSAELAAALGEARSAITAREQFLSTMSHELRTPMIGVLGMTELLLLSDPDPDNRDRLYTIQRSGTELVERLNDILDLAKIRSGGLSLNPDRCVLAESLDRVTRKHVQEARRRDVEFAVVVQPNLPKNFILDGPRLEQALDKLCCNAVKFTNSGYIQLRAFGEQLADDRWSLSLELRDTGCGMTKEQQRRVVEPFVQLESGHDRSHGGCGLGLALAGNITQLMQGSLSISSELGSGSSVTVSLEAQSAPEHASPPTPVSTHRRDCRVLVAEDNPVNLKVAQGVLLRLGYNVTVARNGAEALKHCEEQRFDIILMDCQMPVIDGLEATRRLRKQIGWTSSVPIIAVTANALAGDREDCLRAGMNEHLAKPFGTQELDELIQLAAKLQV